MSDLAAMFHKLGFEDVTTLLQSGNIVFRGSPARAKSLESWLESETASRLKVVADYLIRTVSEWQKIVDENPYPTEAAHDPGHLVVMVLKTHPTAERLKSLATSIRGPEQFKARGKQLYIVYPDGIGRSKFTGTLIERVLGIRGTARNWNTVLRLAELARGNGGR